MLWLAAMQQHRLACMRHLPTGPGSLARIRRYTVWRNRDAQSSEGEIANKADVACCGTR